MSTLFEGLDRAWDECALDSANAEHYETAYEQIRQVRRDDTTAVRRGK